MSPQMALLVQNQLQHLLSPKGIKATEEDNQLLKRYGQTKDQQAFAQLVRRHGSMVLGVARRVVGDYHVAEDVLQATFLVLAEKARWREWHRSIAPWLYVTAYRLACNARRRRKKESKIAPQLKERHSSQLMETLRDSGEFPHAIIDKYTGQNDLNT